MILYGRTEAGEDAHQTGIYLRNTMLNYAFGLECSEADFAQTVHGKPYLKNHAISFSVSHSGGLVICAVQLGDKKPKNAQCNPPGIQMHLLDTTASGTVGADIERLEDRDRSRLMRRFFSPAEQAFAEKSETPTAAFFQIWTGKESLCKMDGRGLSIFSAVQTVPKPFVPPMVEEPTREVFLWQTLLRESDGEYALSICARLR